MTIQELIDEMAQLDPSLEIRVEIEDLNGPYRDEPLLSCNFRPEGYGAQPTFYLQVQIPYDYQSYDFEF